jgi:hypothetical protein
VLGQRCLALATPTALADLPAALDAAGAQIDGLPRGATVTVELAVFSPATLSDCPRWPDHGADPLATSRPTFFGRSAPVVLDGASPLAVLTLACLMPQVTCQPDDVATSIRATLTDPSGIPPPGDAVVRAGLIYQPSLADGFEFDPLGPLVPTGMVSTATGVAVVWTSTADPATCFPVAHPKSSDELPDACPATLVTHPGSTDAVVSCDGGVTNGTATLAAHFIDPTLATSILASVGVNIPPGGGGPGVIVGRVVDGQGTPVEGEVVVGESGWTIHVLYPSNGLPPGGFSTDPMGWFVIDQASPGCCGHLSASPGGSSPGDGSVSGLVHGATTVTVLHVQ